MSGGKDSTAAVLILQRKGYEVVAVTMAMGLEGDQERIEKLKILCSFLKVPLQVVEFSGPFDRFVRLPFASAYLSDKTPNPCAMCNREIKFGRFMEEALRISGANRLATGHYADICTLEGKKFLCEPLELRKSQIYFLALIDPGRLARVLFPLADKSLDEVRDMTRDLPLVNREESQDVCFLAGEKLSGYLSRELDAHHTGEPGEIVDSSGRVLGTHNGLVHYTIGQRRGLRFAAGRRMYVIAKDGLRNRLILGEEQELLSDRIRTILPVYWRPLLVGETLDVRIRYHATSHRARVISCSDEGFELALESPVLSVTPGQISVLYEKNHIVAGAEIL